MRQLSSNLKGEKVMERKERRGTCVKDKRPLMGMSGSEAEKGKG